MTEQQNEKDIEYKQLLEDTIVNYKVRMDNFEKEKRELEYELHNAIKEKLKEISNSINFIYPIFEEINELTNTIDGGCRIGDFFFQTYGDIYSDDEKRTIYDAKNKEWLIKDDNYDIFYYLCKNWDNKIYKELIDYYIKDRLKGKLGFKEKEIAEVKAKLLSLT